MGLTHSLKTFKCFYLILYSKAGSTVGKFELKGVKEFRGQIYKVWFKNENLISWRNGEVDITVSDLISVLTPD